MPHTEASNEPASGRHGSSRETSRSKPRSRTARFLANHRRVLILVCAAAMLASYFAKDVLGEDVKDELAVLNTSASEHRMVSAWEQDQLRELANLEELLKKDPNSIPRIELTVSLGTLALRAQTIASAQFWFTKSMLSRLPTSEMQDVSRLLGRTGTLADNTTKFLAHTPKDGASLVSQASALRQELSALESEAGRVGANLSSFELQVSERLEARSQLIRYGITVLYVLTLILTVASSLYGLELPETG